MIFQRLLAFLFLLGSLIWSCQTSSSHSFHDNPSAELQLAEATLDSCTAFIPRWQQKLDSLSNVNEFEALKIQNNLNILEENLNDLKRLVAQDLRSLSSKEDEQNHLLQLSTQTQYVQALLASGKAIYEEHSQSFGKWKKE